MKRADSPHPFVDDLRNEETAILRRAVRPTEPLSAELLQRRYAVLGYKECVLKGESTVVIVGLPLRLPSFCGLAGGAPALQNDFPNTFKDIFLDYAGQRDKSDPIHAALARLQHRDRLEMRLSGKSVGLFAPGNVCVAPVVADG